MFRTLSVVCLLSLAAICCCIAVKANDTTYHKNKAIHYVVNKDTLLLLRGENGEHLMKQGRWLYSYISQNGRHCGFTVRDNNIIEEAYYLSDTDGSYVDTIFTALPLTSRQRQQITDSTRRLYRMLKYPPHARRLGIAGKVYLSFVIDTAGHIVYLKALTHIGYGLEEAAITAARELKFTPILYKGRHVNIQFKLPLQFVLQ